VSTTYRTVLEDEPCTHGGGQADASGEEEPPPVRIVLQDADVHAEYALFDAVSVQSLSYSSGGVASHRGEHSGEEDKLLSNVLEHFPNIRGPTSCTNRDPAQALHAFCQTR
jgi:hypothetical protein